MKERLILMFVLSYGLFACNSPTEKNGWKTRPIEISIDSVYRKNKDIDSIFNSFGQFIQSGQWISPNIEALKLIPLVQKHKGIQILSPDSKQNAHPYTWKTLDMARGQLESVSMDSGNQGFQLKNSIGMDVVTGRNIAFHPRSIDVGAGNKIGSRVGDLGPKVGLKTISTETGFEVGCVWSFCQDTSGTLWLGSRGAGLLSFNGNDFSNWDRREGLPGNTIRNVQIDKKGRIWMATWGQGICIKDGDRFFQFSEDDGLSCNLITKIFIDSKDRIWFGTEYGGAGFIDGDKLFQFSKKEGLKEKTILDIDESLNGEIFFATFGAHMCSWDGEKFYYWDAKIGINESKVWCLRKDLKGDLWIGTWGGGVYKWDGNVLKKLVVSDGNLIGPIMCMDCDERGNVWLGTYGKGLLRIGGDGIEVFDSKRGLVAEKVMDVMVDRYNRVWISTEGSGIQVLNNSPFEHYPTPKGWEISGSNHLLAARNNDIWMGSSETGMVLLHENQFADISSQYEVGNTFYDLIEGRDGKVWIATDGSGIFCVDPNGCMKYNRDRGLCSNVITALFEDSRQRIWMAFDNNKVAYLQNDSLYVINEHSSETRSAIKSFTEDDQGNLYWGVNDMGMVKCSFQNNQPQLMIYSRNEGFNFRSFSDLCFFNGSIWVCSESGIVQWSNEKWSCMDRYLGKEMGQAFSFQPWNHRLMVWTEKGLIALVQDINEENKSIASRKGSLQSYSIHRSTQFEDEHVITTRDAEMVVDNQSNLLFSSGGVILKIKDSQWEQERVIGKPKVTLTKINGTSYQSSLYNGPLITSKDGASQHLTNPICFEYKENNLAFSFSSGAESILAKESFTYRLKGIQDEWSIPNAEREIEFLSLPSGSFELQVAIVFSNGKISPISTLPFTINPPWWLSFWAKVIYVLMAIGCIGLYIRWRIFKLQKDQRKLQQKIDEATKEIVAQKKQAIEQGEQILESQRLIVESIEYAKRIQTAILPPKKLVQSFLPKSFIFYQPKDIVAGDFYWMETIKRMDEEWIAFAVADCTGHGVPGALMSVLCHNGLSRSVMEHGLFYPNEILNKSREIVIHELGDDENALNDGMDISLCVLNQNTLFWSGANRPLWIVRNHEIIEFKGDKQPVGRFHNYFPFSLQQVNLKSGDLVFVFTDGYIDQFGGHQGKKFKANQLKEKLIELCDMDSEDIRENLANTFTEWKGDLEQVDDVCLIGFKF